MTDVLREYLVGLGFRIDEASYRKFIGGVTRTTKDVTELGSEAVATGLAIGVMVETVARHYEELYYVSQRSGSSVANLQAAGFAAKQVGLSVDTITQAIEQFSMTQRMNPGVAALVSGFSTAKDKTTQFIETIEKLQGMEFYKATAIGNVMGLDPKTLLMLFQQLPRFKAEMVEHKRLIDQAGYSSDDAADKFLTFTRSVDHLGASFQVLKDRIALDFVEPVESAVKAIDELIQAFSRFNKETEGKAGVVGTIATTGLAAWLGKKLLWRLLGLGGETAAAGAGGAAAGAGGGAAAAAGGGVASFLMRWGLGPLGMLLGSGGPAEGGPDLMRFDPKSGRWVPIPGRGGQPVEAPATRLPQPPSQDVPKPKDQDKAASGSMYQGLANWGKNERPIWEPLTLDKASKMGMPGFGEMGDAGKLAGAKSAEWGLWLAARWGVLGGMMAQAADPLAYGATALAWHGMGRSAVADARKQFRAGKSVEDIEFAPGSAADLFGLISGLKNRFAPGLGQDAFNSRFSGELAPAGGGVTNYRLDQKTEIVIPAGPTALATAQAVMDGQRNVNSDAVRNFRPVIR